MKHSERSDFQAVLDLDPDLPRISGIPSFYPDPIHTSNNPVLLEAFNHLPDILWVEDWPSQKVLIYNHRADRYLGISRKRAKIPQIPLLLESTHPADRGKIQQACLKIYTPSATRSHQFEVRVLDTNGESRVFDCYLSALQRAPDGKPIRVLWLLRDLTEQRQYEETLRLKGYRDSLTGLFNRAYFDEQITRWNQERELSVAIIVMDVDGLKSVNDRYGHQAGDRLLQTMGHLLGKVFREDDAVARIGGDEYAVLLPGWNSATVRSALQRVRKVFRRYNLANPANPISVSIGATMRNDGEPLQVTFRRADEKMYQKKRTRKASIAYTHSVID
jgi:diguanylate cyclase (GGDEF)-like protein